MRVLFAANDPGGCDSLVPIIKSFCSGRQHEICCVMGGKSKEVLRKEGIMFSDFDILGEGKSLALISDFGPDVVVTGTSFGLSPDKKVVGWAKSRGIKTISVVDYWSNYWNRFRDVDSGKDYLPDIICVIDDIMRQEMIAEGFDADILRVTGNPSFDFFAKFSSQQKMNKNQFLFLSQPFTEMAGENIGIGYTEMDALKDVIWVVGRLEKSVGKKFRLIIRPHPRENPEKFRCLLNRSGEPPECILDASSDIGSLIASSRLVIGMSSVVLLRAAMGGRTVISYQPGVKKDLSILGKLGVSETITEKRKLFNKIRSFLLGDGKRSAGGKTLDRYRKNGSTFKVMKEVTNLVYGERAPV